VRGIRIERADDRRLGLDGLRPVDPKALQSATVQTAPGRFTGGTTVAAHPAPGRSAFVGGRRGSLVCEMSTTVIVAAAASMVIESPEDASPGSARATSSAPSTPTCVAWAGPANTTVAATISVTRRIVRATSRWQITELIPARTLSTRMWSEGEGREYRAFADAPRTAESAHSRDKPALAAITPRAPGRAADASALDE
jgi:hypothetical protein